LCQCLLSESLTDIQTGETESVRQSQSVISRERERENGTEGGTHLPVPAFAVTSSSKGVGLVSHDARTEGFCERERRREKVGDEYISH